MWWQESNVLEHWILDVGGKPVSFSQTQSQLLSTSTIIRYHKSHKYSTSCQIQINVDPTTKDKCLQLNIEYPHICIYIIYIYIYKSHMKCHIVGTDRFTRTAILFWNFGTGWRQLWTRMHAGLTTIKLWKQVRTVPWRWQADECNGFETWTFFGWKKHIYWLIIIFPIKLGTRPLEGRGVMDDVCQ